VDAVVVVVGIGDVADAVMVVIEVLDRVVGQRVLVVGPAVALAVAVADVADAVGVDVGLQRVGRRAAVVERVGHAVGVAVGVLAAIVGEGVDVVGVEVTVAIRVACVAEPVAIHVALRRVRVERAVVGDVVDHVVVDVRIGVVADPVVVGVVVLGDVALEGGGDGEEVVV